MNCEWSVVRRITGLSFGCEANIANSLSGRDNLAPSTKCIGLSAVGGGAVATEKRKLFALCQITHSLNMRCFGPKIASKYFTPFKALLNAVKHKYFSQGKLTNEQTRCKHTTGTNAGNAIERKFDFECRLSTWLGLVKLFPYLPIHFMCALKTRQRERQREREADRKLRASENTSRCN